MMQLTQLMFDCTLLSSLHLYKYIQDDILRIYDYGAGGHRHTGGSVEILNHVAKQEAKTQRQ